MAGARQAAVRVDPARSTTVEELAQLVHKFQRDVASLQRSIPVTRTVEVSVRGADLPVLVAHGMPTRVTDVVLGRAAKRGADTDPIDVGSLNWRPSENPSRPGVLIDFTGPDVDDDQEYLFRLIFYAERA